MAFNREQVAELLVRCRRRCCICHQFCGVKIETDHIEPVAEGGMDDIINAIPVCFSCHAEIHSYNDRHPRGRKFTSSELRRHKEQWLQFCDKGAGLGLTGKATDTDVGPLHALIDEIEFNLAAAKAGYDHRYACPLRDEQFSRAIHTGSVSLLLPELKTAIIDAYVAAGHASSLGESALSKRAGGYSHSLSGSASGDPAEAYQKCERLLLIAHDMLVKFLGHGDDAD